MNVITAWRTNNELLADAFGLLEVGKLWRQGEPVLDVTYHDGGWWRGRFQVENLSHYSRLEDPTFDFANIDRPAGSFRVVCFDPPYSGKGGRATSGVAEMDARYGLNDSPPTADELLVMNKAGLTECCRVASHVVLLKSMTFIEGGELHTHTRHLENHAETLGWVAYEQLIHQPKGARPQPEFSKCVHCVGDTCSRCEGTGKFRRAELHARQRPSIMTILVPYSYRRGLAHRKVYR